ncbi:hypothetical protein ACIBG8_14605 [Nonomuraea sp. NPDC050556]|uniref:hypothetical protein n=1 Tax=Nonomuraea sp. NPDC050556 TaxID=3364369 RepID=UPI0037A62138
MGTTSPTLYSHLRADPDFRRSAEAARVSPWRGPAPDASWHDPLVTLIEAGMSITLAAEVLNLQRSKAGYHRSHDYDGLHDRVNNALQTGGVQWTGRRPWRVDHERLFGVLRHLALGWDLKGAARLAGVPLATVKGWRRRLPDVDAVIVAVAQAAGTPLNPYTRLTCPGQYCATRTGYDYGCRRTPCRQIASNEVISWRNRDA